MLQRNVFSKSSKCGLAHLCMMPSNYGVPQRSVLGPMLLTIYATPLSATISIFDINHHLYADDNQMYRSSSVSIAKESLEKLKHCLLAVSAWMTGYKLKLNPSETEFILIWTKLQRESSYIISRT